MNLIEKVSGLKNTLEGKVVAVILATLLLVSGFNLSAYADAESETGTSDGTAQQAAGTGSTPSDISVTDVPEPSGSNEAATDTTEAGATEPGTVEQSDQSSSGSGSNEAIVPDANEAAITFEADNVHIVVNDQEVVTPTIKVKLNKEFKFTASPDTGYEIEKISAKNKETEAEIEVNTVEGVSTVAAEYVDSNLVIKVETKASASSSDSQATANPFNARQNSPVLEPENTEPESSETNIESTEGYYTVTLVVGDTTTTVEVRANTLFEKPADPVDSDGTPFHAWFASESDTPFDFSTPITADTTLTAVFNTNHVVQFMDYNGYSIALWSVEDEAMLDPELFPDPGLPIGINLSYWTANPETSEEFEGPVTENITLYPVVAKSAVVMFITNGSMVPSQSSTTGSIKPEQPDNPTRDGYNFKYWATEQVEYDPGNPTYKQYDFDYELSGTTFLYAVWEATNVGYIINFYNEVANYQGDPGTELKNYELVYTKSILASDSNTKAGEMVTSINASLINNRTYADGGFAVWGVLDYSYFGWTDAVANPALGTEGKPLAGNGSTAINVYCKRISYEFKFDLMTATGTYTGASTIDAGGEAHSGPAGYSIIAKFGQDVSGSWPMTCTPIGTTTAKFQNWKSYWSNGPRTIDGASIYQAIGTTGDNYKKANPENNTGRPSTTGESFVAAKPNNLIKAQYGPGTYSEVRYYYTEISLTQAEVNSLTAAGKIIDSRSSTQMDTPVTSTNNPDMVVKHTGNGTTKYYKYNCSNGVTTYHKDFKPLEWPGRAIDGYQTITNTGSVGKRLTDYYQVAYTQLELDTIYKSKPLEKDGSKLGNISYYMNRLDYTLTLVTDGGTIEGATGFEPTSQGYTQQLVYDASIQLPSAEPVKVGYEFLGWYTDDACTKPFTATTMPANDVTLYAKYRGTAITVNYFDADGKPIITKTYANNEVLVIDDLEETAYAGAKPDKKLDGIGVFENWYYEASKDVYVVAYWGMPLTFNSNNNTYNLYANISPLEYTVTLINQDANGDYTDENGNPTKEEFSKAVPSGSHNTLAKQGVYDGDIRNYMRGGEAPHGHGYTFIDWYTEENGAGDIFTTGTPVLNDITLYGYYKENLLLTGAIDNGGAVSNDDQLIVMDNSSKDMTFTAATGYHITNVEIYENGALVDTVEVNSGSYTFTSVAMTENLDVVANTALNEYAVTFYSQGGSAVAAQTVVHGQKATKPADPTRTGYSFAGWYTDQNLATPFDFNSNIVADTDVWAKWEAVPVPVTPPTTPVDPPVTPPTPPNDPLAEIITPIAEVMEGIVESIIPLTTEIAEDGTPLAAGDQDMCWVHYYIMLGILLSAVYGMSVIARRRHFTKNLDSFEEGLLEDNKVSQAMPDIKAKPGFATN